MIKNNKIKFGDDYRYPDDVECRNYDVHRHDVESPSSRVIYFNCPFCATEVKAYVWSLCGGGKRCPSCSAMFGGSGSGIQFKKLIKNNGRL